MKWTENKPTESGIYWAVDSAGEQVVVDYAKSSLFGEAVFVFGTEIAHSTDDFTDWYGPITPPEDE